MISTIIYISSLSVIIPAICGLLRSKKIHQVFFPFLFCIGLSVVNEISSILITVAGSQVVVTNNIYVLVEAILLTWQFKKWEIFSRPDKFFSLRISLVVLLWLIDTLFISGITNVSSYFRIGYSFMLVLLGINMVNALLISQRKTLFQNSVFVICTCIITFYTFKVFVEIFWLYGHGLSKAFMTNMYQIMIILNLVCNLLYTLAILWMPRKIHFTLPY